MASRRAGFEAGLINLFETGIRFVGILSLVLY